MAGQIVKRIPVDMREKYPEIPWREMAGMRDILIHQYFAVNPEVVWKTISVDVPEILPRFQKIFADGQGE